MFSNKRALFGFPFLLLAALAFAQGGALTGPKANVYQFGGQAVQTGTGVGGPGVPRVTVSSDSFPASQPVSGTVAVSNFPATQAVSQSGTWTNRVVGNIGGIFDAGNNTTLPANVLSTGFETIAPGTQPTQATAGNIRRGLASTEGVQYVQQGNSNDFSCFLQAITVTTQCQPAPAAGLRAYITSISLTNQAATVQTLDIVEGTGAACATGITALSPKWQFGTAATTTSPFVVSVTFPTPIVPLAANAICLRPSAATAFGVLLTGYIAP